MKKLVYLLLLLVISNTSYGNDKSSGNISVSIDDVTLDTIINELSQISEFKLDIINFEKADTRLFSLHVENSDLEDALKRLLKDYSYFLVRDDASRTISISISEKISFTLLSSVILEGSNL